MKKLPLALSSIWCLIFALLTVCSVNALSYSNFAVNQSYCDYDGAVDVTALWDPSYGYWDISTASYVQSFGVGSQDSNPTGVFFSASGNKMYVVGYANDNVYEYSLSSSWDVSTASYVQSFSVSAQDDSPSGVFFNGSGNKMYVVGYGNDSVYEYSLSDPWNVSSASYVQSFDISSQTGYSAGIFFNGTGNKMYVIGFLNDRIYEYTLSDPWNVSSASFVQSFSVDSQDAVPKGIFFNETGNKVYVVGRSNDKVYEYSLSDPWNISTASYVQSFDISSQDDDSEGVFFNTLGNKMYMIGDANNNVYEYTLKCKMSSAYLQSNETGNWSNVSYLDMSSMSSPYYSNITYTFSNASCDSDVGLRILANDTGGNSNTTTITIVRTMPYLVSSTGTSVINSIYSCANNTCFSLKPQAAGSPDLVVYSHLFRRTGFTECNYQCDGCDRIECKNETDYCILQINTSNLDTDDTLVVGEYPGTSGVQPSNLPAALAGGVITVIVVIYAISRSRRGG